LQREEGEIVLAMMCLCLSFYSFLHTALSLHTRLLHFGLFYVYHLSWPLLQTCHSLPHACWASHTTSLSAAYSQLSWNSSVLITHTHDPSHPASHHLPSIPLSGRTWTCLRQATHTLCHSHGTGSKHTCHLPATSTTLHTFFWQQPFLHGCLLLSAS